MQERRKMKLNGGADCARSAPGRGVWGHAPPEKLKNSGFCWCILERFWYFSTKSAPD